MDKKLIRILLSIASLCLSVAGLIFVGLSIFYKDTSAWSLPSGLACVVLASIFNIIRTTALKAKE